MMKLDMSREVSESVIRIIVRAVTNKWEWRNDDRIYNLSSLITLPKSALDNILLHETDDERIFLLTYILYFNIHDVTIGSELADRILSSVYLKTKFTIDDISYNAFELLTLPPEFLLRVVYDEYDYTARDIRNSIVYKDHINKLESRIDAFKDVLELTQIECRKSDNTYDDEIVETVPNVKFMKQVIDSAEDEIYEIRFR